MTATPNDAGDLGGLMTLAAIAYANDLCADATILKGDVAAELANRAMPGHRPGRWRWGRCASTAAIA